MYAILEKMRSTYGKLVYLLQDSVNPEIQELLQFSCKKSIKTVYTGAPECIRELDLIVLITALSSTCSFARA